MVSQNKNKEICLTNDSTLYQFRVKKVLWEDFKACLRKVYWKEGLAIDEGIIKLIEKFVKENE